MLCRDRLVLILSNTLHALKRSKTLKNGFKIKGTVWDTRGRYADGVQKIRDDDGHGLVKRFSILNRGTL